MSAPLFLLNLALTVVFLVVALATGVRGRRPAHYRAVGTTVALLALAILQAELFGRGFRFEPIRLRIHLGFAAAALLCLPGAVASGVALVRGRGGRRGHRAWVGGFVFLVLLAVLSAGWMFLGAEPIAA
ncbi:MAG: hypothetical protein D6702_00245 [Planctomycetota bacterium]|nr:MAG: hypothetical protein D6702_00245 [Planctomycetota bacterium]